MTKGQVKQVKDRNCVFFLKRCRCLVHPPVELVKRLDGVIEDFGIRVDNVSK
ncbi:unnamed protein product [Hapterophycus canaliculatus]